MWGYCKKIPLKFLEALLFNKENLGYIPFRSLDFFFFGNWKVLWGTALNLSEVLLTKGFTVASLRSLLWGDVLLAHCLI